jgi:DASH complex subunit ASK1
MVAPYHPADPPVTPQQYDGGDYDSDSDSLDEVNNTAHPSAAFLMAQAASGSGGSFDEDDSFQSQDSLDQADVDLNALGEGVVDVHPFARGGYAYTGDDSFDDETFDAGVPEETVFGRPPVQRAQARLSEAGELLMYGDEASVVPDTMQYGMVGSSPTPHYSSNRG